ncbi:MAG: pyruvate, phosphate dikinase [Actinobacteria bacterium HGW-Actinobacteria-9]|nr:MAG: pyruvate, phosphate dikinase [Actinobacteria bacterium HGW-Actinobacteria-9]
MSEVKRVYAFGGNRTEGNKDMKFILGGKGANLAEMANMGLPVPPGFTISCQACMEYYDSTPPAFPQGLAEEIAAYIDELETKMGKKLGDPNDPLLVSVRSGSPFSMPGMMDTVLNLGLNDISVQGLIAQTGNERFAWDSYRRFIQMFSKVVLDEEDRNPWHAGDKFENAITEMKRARGVETDTDLDANDMKELVGVFKKIVADNAPAENYPQLVVDGKIEFPQDPAAQLQLAIEAVFRSWNNRRARDYRRMERIADDLGTAVNVQSMVFGNKGETSATGVAFTRNPADGTNELYGDYLTNAQGEDVVAGIRVTKPLADLPKELPEAGAELWKVFDILEKAYRDMCDIEFTIEQGKLWMLQTRVGKRTARAALKVAVDMVEEGMISREEAVLRIDPAQLDQLLHPQFDVNASYDVLAKGLNASPGAAVGEVIFSADAAEEAAAAGRKVILVRWETTPDDLHGMIAAQGILTSHGGKTSHAAVVARGMGKPAVCGAEKLKIDAAAKQAIVSGTDVVLREGDIISIDGTTGIVVLGAVTLVEPEVSGDFDTILSWADEFRTMGVRANADTPDDAALGRKFGAAGIGLCRTEHMFLGERKDIIQRFVLADDDADARRTALDELLAAQVGDYLGIFEAMDGLPVTVRLLDPPLHEFLDSPRELEVEIVKAECAGEDPSQLAAKRKLLSQIDAMAEMNPMLGLRGCRLGIMFPELYSMQVRAITQAACQLKKAGKDPRPEIMIPLVSLKAELETLRAESEKIVAQVQAECGIELHIPIGTMIELPRAAVMAEEIGAVADFFSFGTNDLTQTTFGFSRDDIESKFLPRYLERKVLARNPFETVDEGVAKLVELGCKGGRAANPSIHLGVCGEHGGDPDSVKTFFEIGLDYVSCSPYRLPLARLAAAQAGLAKNAGKSDNR